MPVTYRARVTVRHESSGRMEEGLGVVSRFGVLLSLREQELSRPSLYPAGRWTAKDACHRIQQGRILLLNIKEGLEVFC